VTRVTKEEGRHPGDASLTLKSEPGAWHRGGEHVRYRRTEPQSGGHPETGRRGDA